MSTIRTILCVTLAVAAVRAAAQEAEPALDPETGLVQSISELVVLPEELADAWLELTPLADPEAPAMLKRIGDRTAEDELLRLEPEVPPGTALLCAGAAGAGVLCEQVYVPGEAWVERGESLTLVVGFEPGLAIQGRYLLDGWPIAAARVAVVPAGLKANRPFTMPLALALSPTAAPAMRREVTSDDDGFFALPPLAEGEYFLETLLPSGRVHRSEPFLLPDPGSLRLETGAGEDDVLVWDLGEIDAADGLVVEFRVTDPFGEPLAGARVAGRQGQTADRLINYQTVADEDGVAYLSGFSVEQAVRLGCRQPGYEAFEQEYPLLPVLVSCTLQPLAALRGEVLAIEGLPPPGAAVSLERISDQTRSAQTRSAQTPAAEAPAADTPSLELPAAEVDAAGRFVVAELAAGDYRLIAAAPGFGVEERTFTLEPGERRSLEPIILLHGRAVAGRVLDDETREPIAGAELRAVSPPGAALEVTDEDGEFSLATRIREPLVLSLAAEDYVEREITLTPERLAEREPLLFTLERGGRIRAVVWSEATDLPCQSCRLVIRPTSQELTTGSAGEALSAALAPGWYRVHRPRVSHLGSTVVAEDDAEIRHVRVRRGETSTVRFGEQRRSVRVVFRPSPGAGWSLTARTPSRSERYHPDAGGGFRVRHRSGESQELFLHRFEPETGAEVEVRQATLPAELNAAELTLPLAGGGLHGRATSGGGALAGIEIRLRSLDHALRARTRSRPDGTFRVPHLPAGVYAVLVGERNVQFVGLRAGQTLDLGTFELTAGSF